MIKKRGPFGPRMQKNLKFVWFRRISLLGILGFSAYSGKLSGSTSKPLLNLVPQTGTTSPQISSGMKFDLGFVPNRWQCQRRMKAVHVSIYNESP